MPKTYNDLYFLIRQKLRLQGVEAYAQEARILLEGASGKSKEELLRDLYLYSSDEIEQRAMSMLERRQQGEPLAYITGRWDFRDLSFTITHDVLIPRPDTELLVEAAVKAITHFGMRGRVLDLCCGSGCIACCIASELPQTRVVAADISNAALEVSRKNIKDNKLASRIVTINADATTWPPVSIGSFDIVVSNPPYIASQEILTLDSSVRDYEPLGALDGGEDGLDFYRSIIKYWTITLRPRAFMMFEVGEGQAEPVKQMLLDAGYAAVTTLKDTIGVERVVIGQWKNEF